MSNEAMLLTLAGPVLASYLQDPATIEVMVNPNGACFVERFGAGMQEAAPVRTEDLDRFLSAVADRVRQVWTAAAPSLHAALPAVGWRIQAARPPQTPALTMALRKHPKQMYPLEDYLAKGILTPAQVQVLREALASRKRILISGATGSAKSSLLNALLHELTATDLRLGILEDDPELICTARNCFFLRLREGIDMAGLVMEALRYRPDWVIVGEVRSGAALDMLWAFRTGHGGMATVHAESVQETLGIVESLVLRASRDPQREMIGQALDLIVHMARHGRSWRCTGLLAVEGYHQGAYHLRPLAEAT